LVEDASLEILKLKHYPTRPDCFIAYVKRKY